MSKYIFLEIKEDNFSIGVYNKKTKEINFLEKFEESDVATSLKYFINKNKVKTKKIKLILKDKKILIKFISHKRLNENEFAALFNNNKSNYFPVNENNYIIDYKIIETNNDYIKVMIVGINKDQVINYIDIFKKLKLTCEKIDTYENLLGKIICNQNNENNLCVTNYNDKVSVIHMNKSKMKNIRIFTLEDNIYKLFQQEFSFFHSDLQNIKNIYFVDENPILEKFFQNYNCNLIKNKEIDSILGNGVNN